jgi:hypothetical protein
MSPATVPTSGENSRRPNSAATPAAAAIAMIVGRRSISTESPNAAVQKCMRK